MVMSDSNQAENVSDGNRVSIQTVFATPKSTRPRGRPPGSTNRVPRASPSPRGRKRGGGTVGRGRASLGSEQIKEEPVVSSIKKPRKSNKNNASGDYSDLFAFQDDDEEEEEEDDDDEIEDPSDHGWSPGGAVKGHRRSARLAKQVEQMDMSHQDDDYDSSEEEEDADSVDDEDDEEIPEGCNDVNLFAEPSQTQQQNLTPVTKKDIYDFDTQSIHSGAPFVQQEISTRASRRRRTTAPTAEVVPNQVSSTTWGSNIYSSLAAYMKTRQEMECYNAFVACSKLNSSLDRQLVQLCQPNAAHSSLFYGPGASLQSLLARISSPDRIYSILSNLVNKAQEQLSHRIVYYVPVVFSSIFSFDYFPSTLEAINTVDNQVILNYAMILDNDVNLISRKFDLFRNSEDVRNIVVADDVYEVFNDLVWSDRPSTCRLVVAMNSKKTPISFFILDTWNRNEVPVTRDRIEMPKQLADQMVAFVPDDKQSIPIQKSLEHDLREYLEEMIAWIDLQSDSPSKSLRSTFSSARFSSYTDISLYDSFIVKPYGKKDTVLLVVSCNDSLVVFNIISEQKFIFSRHGLSKHTVVNVENGHTTYPDQLIDERSLLVVPEEIYSALKENYKRLNLKSTSKFVILDIDKRTTLGAAEDFEADIYIQHKSQSHAGVPPTAYFNTPVTPEEEAVHKGEQYRLVVINGMILGLQIDAQKVVRRAVEILPLKVLQSTGNAQGIICSNPQLGSWDFSQSHLSSVRIGTEKSASAVYFHGCHVTYFDPALQSSLLSYGMDQQADLIFDMPVQYSLYDVVFRLAQASLPQSLALNNAEGTTNSEQPLFCVFCIRETRVTHQNFSHEMRHLDLPRRYRCHDHDKVFTDYRTYRQHIRSLHSDQDNEEADALEAADEVDNTNVTLMAGAKILRNRMDGPHCEKCLDYFPNVSSLHLHSPVCDGVSFSVRTPFSRRANRNTSQPSLICGVCGRGLGGRDHLRYHFTSVHNQCRCCLEQFTEINELSKHYADHYNRILLIPDKEVNKIMTCQICQEFYGTRHDFYFHQWSVHGILPQTDMKTTDVDGNRVKRSYHRLGKDGLSYNATGAKRQLCKLCQLPIRVMGTEYQRHLSTKHGIDVDPNLICRICFELYDDPNKLSEHLASEHFSSGEYINAGIQTIYRCDKCPFMGFQKNLFMHALTVHNDTAPLLYECMTCSERFPDRRLWRQHLEKHVEGYAYECQLCSQAFRARYALHIHMRNYHVDDDDNVDVGPMQCDYCELSFPTYSELREHIAVIHPEANLNTEFECLICRRAFANSEELQKHERGVHSGACKCDICGKLFVNQRAHQKHRIKHFRARMFQCTDCMATFKSKLSMKRHIRVEHLLIGPEKFECQICGKIVSQISMHMLTHKEARFECEFCGRRFTKSCYYNEHVRIHKGERPYGCHICEMRFNKKSNLNVHLRMHEKHKDADGNYLEIAPKGRGSSTIHSRDPFAMRRMCTSASVGTRDFIDLADFAQRTKACDTSDLHLWSFEENKPTENGPPAKRLRQENGTSNVYLSPKRDTKFTVYCMRP